MSHGICRAHVNRNVAKLVGGLGEQALSRSDPTPERLAVTIDEFIDDLLHFQLIIALRPEEGPGQLWRLFERYRYAPVLAAGEPATM